MVATDAEAGLLKVGTTRTKVEVGALIIDSFELFDSVLSRRD